MRHGRKTTVGKQGNKPPVICRLTEGQGTVAPIGDYRLGSERSTRDESCLRPTPFTVGIAAYIAPLHFWVANTNQRTFDPAVSKIYYVILRLQHAYRKQFFFVLLYREFKMTACLKRDYFRNSFSAKVAWFDSGVGNEFIVGRSIRFAGLLGINNVFAWYDLLLKRL